MKIKLQLSDTAPAQTQTPTSTLFHTSLGFGETHDVSCFSECFSAFFHYLLALRW